MKKTIIAALCAGSAVPVPAIAQENQPSTGGLETANEERRAAPFSSGEIIVTGELVSKPATISVVDAEAIDILDLSRLSDAVAVLPGIHRNPGNRGGARNETGVFLRGFDQSRVPLLVDGIPVYVPYDGYVDLDRLLTGNIARIEVAKGYVPVTAGPNAMGGAINVVTRRPVRKIEGEAKLSASLNDDGGWRGWRGRARIGTAQQNWYAQASIDWIDIDKTALPDSFEAGLFQPEGNRIQSGSEDLRLGGKVAFTPGQDEYAIGVAIVRGEKGAPPYAGQDASRGTFFGWPRYDKNSFYLATTSHLGAQTTLRVRGYYDTFRNQLLRYDDSTYSSQTRPYAFTSDYDDDTFGGSVELKTSFADGNVTTFAVHAKRDTHREFSPGGRTYKMKDFTMSAGAETSQQLGKGTWLSLGASYERRDAKMADDPATGNAFQTQDRDALNVQGGLTHRLDARNEIHASIARRTRFATMYERYSYRLGNGLPNPDLKPERAINYELGWSSRPTEDSRFSVAAFASDVTNYIQPLVVGKATSFPFGDLTQPANLGKAWFYGLEVEGKVQIAKVVQASVAYTYLKRDGRGDTSDAELYGTPKHKLFLWADIAATDRLSISPSLNWQSGRRTTNVNNGRPISSFAMANLKLSWDVLASARLELSADNLFDTLAEYDDGYPMPGRSFTTALRIQF